MIHTATVTLRAYSKSTNVYETFSIFLEFSDMQSKPSFQLFWNGSLWFSVIQIGGSFFFSQTHTQRCLLRNRLHKSQLTRKTLIQNTLYDFNTQLSIPIDTQINYSKHSLMPEYIRICKWTEIDSIYSMFLIFCKSFLWINLCTLPFHARDECVSILRYHSDD